MEEFRKPMLKGEQNDCEYWQEAWKIGQESGYAIKGGFARARECR